MSETIKKKKISDFRQKKYPRDSYPGYEFDQKELMPQTEFSDGKIDLGGNKYEDVSDGVCFELCRKWIIARNYPNVISDKDKSDKKYGPEIAYLVNNLSSTMIAQALVNTKSRTYDQSKIWGLSQEDINFGKSIGMSRTELYFNEMTRGNAIFGMFHVRNSSGQHAIAFDMRDNNFFMFDPNWGVFDFSRANKETRLQIVKDWLEFIESKVKFGGRYVRNK